MRKSKRRSDDTQVKDAAVLLAMPIVAWLAMVALVVVMVRVTG